MQRKVSGLALVLSMVACGGDDDDSGATADAGQETGDASTGGDSDGGADRDAATGAYAVHLIQPACGPADEPAVRILLGSPAEGDACAVNDLTGNVTLDIWTRDIDAAVTIRFGPEEAMGSGTVCPGDDLDPGARAPCRTYNTGAIRFDTYEDGRAASGSWQLSSFTAEVSGDFDATWCQPDPPGPCG
jgi:hypothetical protein